MLVVGEAFNIGDALFYAVLFIILMWLIKIFAWKPVTKMMQDRSDKIANDIDTAEKSRTEALELAKQRKEALANSQAEANEIINKAQQTGDKRRESIISDANLDAKTIKENAAKDIEQQKRDALASTKDDVADLSIEIASKIIQKNLDANDQKTLIDSYIKELDSHESN
ncbi:F0F1 ATP synthase subunit B [Fructilactobacillus hinvesii]|uniref:ATP synthase subunit b n=1 Tax=Fructilactobacillus hinvesii TaxID=2940300 RepID=A0ABY5BST2_9LACO|nr:F0F1 ATP synthase subunit B [Fructilactobacillus hinvesii]USS87710.1 F0F1 ATP synthase subunit B [Fructilactobacillus hinvesii]